MPLSALTMSISEYWGASTGTGSMETCAAAPLVIRKVKETDEDEDDEDKKNVVEGRHFSYR